ncbi:hypothetical protein AgCh_024709 [Apium graveolens]
MSNTSTVIPLLKEFMANGLRVWIFSGDTDSVVPVTSTKYSLAKMKLQVKTSWYPWIVNQQVGGFTEVYEGNLTFATVRGAGHQVPSYQPRSALALISHFLNGTPLPSPKARVRGSSEHSSTSPALTRVKHPLQPAAKDPDTTSKVRPRHQELSFSARRRGSPSLDLGAPGFTFINKLLKESIYLTCPGAGPLPDPDPGAEAFQEQPLQHTPVVERIVNTRDARSFIEHNQYKYTNVPVAEEHMANLTSDELAEAIRLYRQEQTRLQEEAELAEEPEESGDSQQSKRFVFDRIEAKGKKSKKDQGNKKEAEAAKQKRLEEMREQIKKEEEAKLELKI